MYSGSSVECAYETRSGQSRTDALKEINNGLQAENDRLREMLVSSGYAGQLPQRPTELNSALVRVSPMPILPHVQGRVQL